MQHLNTVGTTGLREDQEESKGGRNRREGGEGGRERGEGGREAPLLFDGLLL
jgi:hypothetical protein